MQAVFAGFQMHHPEGGGEVEHGGNDRRLDHFVIFDAQRLGHDEGHRAHDRRHDLPAHGGGGFHAAGEGRAIAEAFHQRDGELAGGHHIGDAGTRDRAHQARRNDRHLGRATARMANKAERDIGEELDHAGAFEERAEQDEQKDVGGRHVDRNAINAFRAIGHVVDDLAEIIAAMVQRRGQILAEQAVGEKRAGDDRQGRAHQHIGGGKDGDERDHAEDDVERQGIAGAQEQRLVLDVLIERDGHTGERQCPGQRLDGRGAVTRLRHQRENQERQETDVEGSDDLARQADHMRGGGNLVQRENHRDPEEQPADAIGPELTMRVVVQFSLGRARGLASLCIRHRALRFPCYASGPCRLSARVHGTREGSTFRAFLSRPAPGCDRKAPSLDGASQDWPRAGPFPCNSALRRGAAAAAGPWGHSRQRSPWQRRVRPPCRRDSRRAAWSSRRQPRRTHPNG